MNKRPRVPNIDPPTIEVDRTITASTDTVWNLFTDTRRWPEWGPSITAVDCADRRIRTGSTGRVRLVGGFWIPFEITACRRYRWTWRVAGVPATGHRVEPLGEGCLAVFEVPVLAAGYVPICRLALSRLADLAK